MNCRINDDASNPAKYRKKIHKKIYSLFPNNSKCKIAFIHFCDRGVLPQNFDIKEVFESWLKEHQEISDKKFSLNGNLLAVDEQVLSGIEYQTFLNKKDMIDSTPILMLVEAKVK